MAAKAEAAGEHFLFVTPATKLGPGPVTLKLTYRGELSEKNSGGLFQVKRRSKRSWTPEST